MLAAFLSVAALAATGAAAAQSPSLPHITTPPTNFPTVMRLGFPTQTPTAPEGDLKRRQNAQTCAFLNGNPGESRAETCQYKISHVPVSPVLMNDKLPPSTAPPVCNAPPTPISAKQDAVLRARPAQSPRHVSRICPWVSAAAAASMTQS